MFYSSFITPWHSHNTLQIVFDLRQRFRFRTKTHGWAPYRGLIIKEDTIHRLDTGRSVQLIIYLDASTPIAGRIRAKYLDRSDCCDAGEDLLHRLRPGELEQCLLEPDKERFEKIVHRLLHMLIEATPSNAMDHRVRYLMRMLTNEPDGAFTIRSLAEKVYLSESRLRNLFRRSTGVSLHQYIIINKISLAISMIMNGSTIEAAAIGSGFTDGSHLHRMIRQLFGISPSQFIRNNAQEHIDRVGDSPLRLITRGYGD